MRRFALAASALAVLATASCDSELIDGIIGDPNVTSMRISLGTQSITISANGNVTGGPINLPAGATINITAAFLTSDGTPDPNVTQASYQLNVTSVGTVSFQRNNVNPFAGTLTTGQASTSQLTFSLYNIEDQENVFGPWPVTTIVSN